MPIARPSTVRKACRSPSRTVGADKLDKAHARTTTSTPLGLRLLMLESG